MAGTFAESFETTRVWLCVRSGTKPLGSVGRAVAVLFCYNFIQVMWQKSHLSKKKKSWVSETKGLPMFSWMFSTFDRIENPKSFKFWGGTFPKSVIKCKGCEEEAWNTAPVMYLKRLYVWWKTNMWSVAWKEKPPKASNTLQTYNSNLCFTTRQCWQTQCPLSWLKTGNIKSFSEALVKVVQKKKKSSLILFFNIKGKKQT